MEIGQMYADYLANSVIEINTDDGYTEIITPFLNQDNYLIAAYVKEIDSYRYIVTDRGETVETLRFYGYESSDEEIKKNLIGTGCSVKNGSIYLLANKNSIGFSIHRLATAIMRVYSKGMK